MQNTNKMFVLAHGLRKRTTNFRSLTAQCSNVWGLRLYLDREPEFGHRVYLVPPKNAILTIDY
jgi:hypothetical protein